MDKGLARLVTSHHSLGHEPAVYGRQVTVPTSTSLLDGGQKIPRKKSHSKTHDRAAIVHIVGPERPLL